MSFDDEANVLKVDIARPALITDPEEKYLSHNFTAGNSYQVMMNCREMSYFTKVLQRLKKQFFQIYK